MPTGGKVNTGRTKVVEERTSGGARKKHEVVIKGVTASGSVFARDAYMRSGRASVRKATAPPKRTAKGKSNNERPGGGDDDDEDAGRGQTGWETKA